MNSVGIDVSKGKSMVKYLWFYFKEPTVTQQ